ncbi:tRNA/rRNA methyltransferase [Erwinia sp. OLTSP20]|uniref:tRNA/rRNA methyltransferase n=1 Tax=unclassified Erwinia TaxID=2622719 RepID=UPI000C18B2CB|nr:MULTISPECIES: tRNA/rRNA methyltransferase [unclassified Erwinia]PIJ49166.1 tRNA/rRNA methyltransferase [Erwinia sp. OAMSP11]PIJ70444.1 tRNA/rRNA methyltransferase [Erwinia sp. OLSSP12]PIJ79937.1 tRNA/rRNA methyltransferase [Erwinia sp. OLCASP19]PIJ81299.1 tRNA/rRNA methyltransferase [Erwinia sp. OLMTSP26]PIJ83886.1 tRNA/rRNA methyltransferase [Erwinia sp. OLMDSP33]
MNDELKGKSGKVKVMYVRGDDEKENRGQNPRTGKGGSRQEKESGWHSARVGDNKGRSTRERNDKHDSSPWRTVSRAPASAEENKPDHLGISGKSFIDPEQLRRQRLEETRVYGENACQALFSSRPEAIVRAWFIQSVTPRFRNALKWLAANRKAYHVVDDAELTKASGTEHHGGVCFLIKKRVGMPVASWLQQAEEQDCVLALEDIGNPHNIGGIMRSCAHFGVKGVLVDDAAVLESGAAVRTAEGGAEHVQAIDAGDFKAGLDSFRKAGYTIVTTSSHQGVALTEAALPQKMVLVLGQERDGLSDSVFQQGDLAVSITGTGHVESLNVSVATGILLAEWWRQNH